MPELETIYLPTDRVKAFAKPEAVERLLGLLGGSMSEDPAVGTLSALRTLLSDLAVRSITGDDEVQISRAENAILAAALNNGLKSQIDTTARAAGLYTGDQAKANYAIVSGFTSLIRPYELATNSTPTANVKGAVREEQLPSKVVLDAAARTQFPDPAILPEYLSDAFYYYARSPQAAQLGADGNVAVEAKAGTIAGGSEVVALDRVRSILSMIKDGTNATLRGDQQKELLGATTTLKTAIDNIERDTELGNNLKTSLRIPDSLPEGDTQAANFQRGRLEFGRFYATKGTLLEGLRAAIPELERLPSLIEGLPVEPAVARAAPGK